MAFHGLGVGAAKGLLMHNFGSEVVGAVAVPLVSDVTKAPVLGYLSPFRAEVSGPRGIQYVNSMVPLAHGVGGREQPVDLRLRDAAAGFTPTNAAGGLVIGRDLAAGVVLGSAGVRVSMEGRNVSGVPVTGSAVFFGGVAQDVDATVSPTSRGVELFATLRSRLSPEELRYRVSLPQGAVLRPSGGGVEVLRGSRVLARVAAPSATDAQGQNVPVTLTVVGDQLVLGVAHRAGGFAYPIIVDPKINKEEEAPGWTFHQGVFRTVETEGKKSGWEERPEGSFVPQGPGGIEAPEGLPYSSYEFGKPSAQWEWQGPKGETITSVNFSFSETYSPKEADYLDFGSVSAGCGGDPTYPGTGSNTFSTRESEPNCPSTDALDVRYTGPSQESSDFKGNLYVNTIVVTEIGETVASESYGLKNAGEPDAPRVNCGGAVNCATGNEFDTHTDLSIGGNPGLGLTRTYNSQLAQSQASPGPFGYGWTGSYGAYISFEEIYCGHGDSIDHGKAVADGEGILLYICTKLAIVHQDNGSTVTFVGGSAFDTEGWYAEGANVEATLREEESGILEYRLPGLQISYFTGKGRLLEEYHGGNLTTLTYNESGQLTKAEEAAKRSITFAYNGEGLVKEATDALGTVKYTYVSGNLTEVTDLDKHVWKYGYNGSHEMTSQTDPLSHTTTREYNGSGQVISEEDPLKRKRTWKYVTSEAGPETTVTNPTGAVTVEHFNKANLPTSITDASGTESAATTTYEYNTYDNLIAVTDPNKHTTKYGYDKENNRTSETDPNSDETKWTYNPEHEVISVTTPKGETTTIEREAFGGPRKVERPAPGGTKQITTYKYTEKENLESVTGPLERTTKYEYDSYGDRTAEIDPEGNKRTWAYNAASQETSAVSPRGNVSGGEPAKFTTTTERDAEGRPLVVTEPENEGKPANKTLSSISGSVQEGQTLTAGAGVWEGASPLTYTYQWQHCNTSGGSCSNVSGATSSTYLLGGGDVGDTLRVVVTATNSAGSASSTSEATATVSSVVPVFSMTFGAKGLAGGQFEGPEQDAIDSHGDVWVADYTNHRIQEFSLTGGFMLAVGWGVKDGKAEAETCTSSCKAGISGSGSGQFEGPYGIAVNQSTNNVYVSDYLANRVQEISSAGAFVASFGSKGTAGAQFSSPEGVAIDSSGNVWVTDSANNRIQELSSSGTFMLAVGWGVKDGKAEAEGCLSSCQAGISGSGNGQLAAPSGIAFLGSDVYVSDYGNDRVDEFTTAGAYVSKFGSKGIGTLQFEGPSGIAAEATSGDLYVADSGNDRVQKLTAAGVFVAAFGSKGSGNGQLLLPVGVAVNSSGDVYVGDHSNNRIEEWESIPSAPVFVSKFGSVGSENGELKEARGVAIAASGNIDVLDTENDRVEEFSTAGAYLGKFGSVGKEHGEFESPRQIAIDSKGDLWIADTGNDRVQEFNEKHEFQLAFGSEGTGAGQFKEPKGIATAPNGDVYVSDLLNNRVEQFNAKGEVLAVFGFGVSNEKAEFEICTSSCKAGISGTGSGQFYQPVGVAVGANGDVWIADYGNNRVEEFNEKDEYLSQFGTKGTGNGQFDAPKGVAIGLEGNVWVVDGLNYRVQEFTPSGTFLTTFGSKGTGNGQFEEPYGIALAANGSAAYIADVKNNRVDAWRPAGAPSNTTPPSISGELIVSQTLSASTGSWSAVPSPTYTYQWQRCNSAGAECANISGATSSTHTLVTADVGQRLRVTVTATNSGGNAAVTSATSEVVIGPRVTKYAYDADGDIESVIDPNGNKTKYTYDADNEPTKVEAPNKAITETEYDSAGQVVKQIDGNKHETKYTRNLLEEVTELEDPLKHKTTKEYDAAGNLTKLTDPLKRTTTYTYDPGNRLIEVKYSDGKTPTVKYEYDKDGDRTVMTDGTGTTKYTYDQLDRMTESENGHKEVVKYEYDLANEQTKITYPNGKAITRAFDKDGRLEKVTDWSEHATKFTYDPDSNLATTTFPTTSVDEDKYAYNDADQMSEVKMLKGTETLASLTYTRDNDGQVKTTTSKGLPGSESTENVYDTNNRLTKAGSTAYEYDAANNPTKLGAGTYKYNNADQLETGPSLTYTYDEMGERTKTKPSTGPTTTYGDDEAGNLISVERPKEGETAEIKDTYAYNGEGLRTSQTISGTTTYLTWDTNEEIPLILSDGTNSYIYGPGGLPVEQVSSGGTVLYLHHDQQGSTRMLTGSTGTVEGTTTYDAYGNKTGSTGTATTPLGYDGQYTSSDTGLIYLRARIYDPATAQFLTLDPLAGETGAPYNYADDNPVNAIDPAGLEGWFGKLVEAANPVHYFKEEISDYENGCSYFDSVAHGLEGVVVGALDVTGVGEEAVAADGAEAAAEDGTAILRHYTDDAGRSAIEDSGMIEAGSYVTLPGEIPPGASPSDVEGLLEISPGKGDNYIDIHVPSSSLLVPDEGPATSGGAWQRQLSSPISIEPNSFLP